MYIHLHSFHFVLWTAYYYCFFFLTGLSPDLQGMDQIRKIIRPTDVPDTGMFNLCLTLAVLFFSTNKRPVVNHLFHN